MPRTLKTAAVLVALVGLLAGASLGASGCGGAAESNPGDLIKNVQGDAMQAARRANLQILDVAVRAYEMENGGEQPTDISQLMKYTSKGSITDPLGGTYYIYQENGEVRVGVR